MQLNILIRTMVQIVKIGHSKTYQKYYLMLHKQFFVKSKILQVSWVVCMVAVASIVQANIKTQGLIINKSLWLNLMQLNHELHNQQGLNWNSLISIDSVRIVRQSWLNDL